MGKFSLPLPTGSTGRDGLTLLIVVCSAMLCAVECVRTGSKKWILVALLVIGVSYTARAAQIYSVVIDTSSVSGSNGLIGFNYGWLNAPSFNATASVSSFTSAGAVFRTKVTGGTGTLVPGPLVFNNSFIGGGMISDLTYGPSISFQLTLDGGVISKPDPTMGGIFFMGFLYDALAIPILSTDRRGRIF